MLITSKNKTNTVMITEGDDGDVLLGKSQNEEWFLFKHKKNIKVINCYLSNTANVFFVYTCQDSPDLYAAYANFWNDEEHRLWDCPDSGRGIGKLGLRKHQEIIVAYDTERLDEITFRTKEGDYRRYTNGGATYNLDKSFQLLSREIIPQRGTTLKEFLKKVKIEEDLFLPANSKISVDITLHDYGE